MCVCVCVCGLPAFMLIGWYAANIKFFACGRSTVRQMTWCKLVGIVNFNKCTPNGPSTLASASLVCYALLLFVVTCTVRKTTWTFYLSVCFAVRDILWTGYPSCVRGTECYSPHDQVSTMGIWTFLYTAFLSPHFKFLSVLSQPPFRVGNKGHVQYI